MNNKTEGDPEKKKVGKVRKRRWERSMRRKISLCCYRGRWAVFLRGTMGERTLFPCAINYGITGHQKRWSHKSKQNILMVPETATGDTNKLSCVLRGGLESVAWYVNSRIIGTSSFPIGTPFLAFWLWVSSLLSLWPSIFWAFYLSRLLSFEPSLFWVFCHLSPLSFEPSIYWSL